MGDHWRNNFRKNEETEPKQKQHPVVDVTGDASKVWFWKQQYCIGTWNVRSMNQGKLDVVRQEMTRLNIDILVISELKWTEMGKFNWDDYYIYYCGQESHRKNGIVPIINKRVWKFEMQYLGATSKMTGWSQVVSKASHSASQLFKSIFHKNL